MNTPRPAPRLALVLLLLSAAQALAALSSEEVASLMRELDDRERNVGDYKTLAYIEQKEKDKPDIARELLIYRRDADDKWLMLTTKPKAEEGKGFLRLDKNFWTYDPSTGKWDRATERERVGGTNSRRSDFDRSRLSEQFDAKFDGEERLGKFDTLRFELTVKSGVDVAYPVIKLWVDRVSHNILKRQEFALSGRLMRTAYYPKWQKVLSPRKKAEVWFPAEIRLFDEIEKANSALLIFKSVDLSDLDANLFTKAWLESKSR